MDSMTAFAMGQANRNKELMVFDWDKCATLIKERKPKVVSAGLSGDWECTGGTIWENDAIVPRENTYTFLASTWATPEIDIDGEVIECYKMKSETDGWDAGTYYPESALTILNSK